MKVWLRQKRNSVGELSSKWIELASKTENEIVLEKIVELD